MAPAATVVVCALRRLDYRRHAVDAERRRPLARRALPPAALRHTATVYRSSTRASAAIAFSRPTPILRRSRSPAGPSALAAARSRRPSACPGVSAVVLLEGINDISAGASADAIIAGMQRAGLARAKRRGSRSSARRSPRRSRPTATRARLTPTSGVRPSTPSSAPAASSTPWPTSTRRPSIRRQAPFATSSCQTAPSAALAIDCIPTGRVIKRMGSAIDIKLFAPPR